MVRLPVDVNKHGFLIGSLFNKVSAHIQRSSSFDKKVSFVKLKSFVIFLTNNSYIYEMLRLCVNSLFSLLCSQCCAGIILCTLHIFIGAIYHLKNPPLPEIRAAWARNPPRTRKCYFVSCGPHFCTRAMLNTK